MVASKYFTTHNTPMERKFFSAAFNGDQKTIEDCILTESMDINRISHTNGQSALHIAIAKKYIALIKFLVTHGANINHIDDNQFTPLYLAILSYDDDHSVLHQLVSALCMNELSNDRNDILIFIDV